MKKSTNIVRAMKNEARTPQPSEGGDDETRSSSPQPNQDIKELFPSSLMNSSPDPLDQDVKRPSSRVLKNDVQHPNGSGASGTARVDSTSCP
jgi:hypothetical protein